MNLSFMRKVMGGGIILAALAGVAPLFAQTTGIIGNVKDENGKPAVAYPIIIERQEIKQTFKTKTDKKGNYAYIGLFPGNYKITLESPDGRPITYNVLRVGLEQKEINFDLARLKAEMEAERQKRIQSDPELQKRLAEQAKQEKEFVGLKQSFDQGQALYAEKRYAEAAAAFEQALSFAKEGNVLVLLERAADSYKQAGQDDKALEFFQKAIQVNPNDANLHNNLGNLYAQMGKVTEAQQEFQKTAELNPAGAALAYYNMGVILYNKGKMDEAVEAFKKAIGLDPKYADAYFLQAQALMGKATLTPDGKVVPAPGTIEALHEYLKLDPSGKFAAAAQQTLDQLQGKVETQFKSAPKKKKG